MEDNTLVHIKEIASKYKISKVILFGSRARGDHKEVSDYDIAIFADGLTDFDRALFFNDIDELPTLKKIDIIFIDKNTKEALIENIRDEGVMIYEQV